jgi:glutathione S-transferase
MSDLKPITVWGKGGTNPPKVAMILEELDIPHDIIATPFTEVKKPEYLAINPNGRLPAIHDPNTDLTLWESGAIVEYLIERYDKQSRLSFAAGSAEYYHAKQWLFFQVSGQGPYFGQAAWFKAFHHEKLPSAVERYTKEINRVMGVLEAHLKREKEKHSGGDGPWLVGGKLSYADISFVSWHETIKMFTSKEELDEANYPLVKEWIANMVSRPKIKSVLEASVAASR